MDKVGAVIVAAGLSSRMGDFKPMMKIGNLSFIEHIIVNFQQADVSPIVVVTGYKGKELEKSISKYGVVCIRNDEFATTQMFDSAKMGFEIIEKLCNRFFFTPADIPMFSYTSVMKMKESKADIVKPICNGVDGHPILINSKLIPGLLKDGSKNGLKDAIIHCDASMEMIAVEDEGILNDADTKDAYHALVKQYNEQIYRKTLDVSIVINMKTKFFKNSCYEKYEKRGRT